MRTILAIGALAIGAAWTVSAQPQRIMKVDVPFAFYTGDTQMSAGEYEVYKVREHAFLVRSVDCEQKALRLANSEIRNAREEESALVFRRYGEDRYFLGEIWRAGSSDGYKIPLSKKEKEAVSSVLVTSAKPSSVIVYARAR